MPGSKTTEILSEWEALARSASLPPNSPKRNRHASAVGVTGAAFALVITLAALWPRNAHAPTVPAGGAEPEGSRSPSVLATPYGTDDGFALPNSSGTCSSEQLQSGTARSHFASSTLLTTHLVVSMPIRNAGAPCDLAIPSVLGFASNGGPFRAVDVVNGGRQECVDTPQATVDRECTFVYPKTHSIQSGDSVRVFLNATWWSWDESGQASATRPPCTGSLRNITEVRFPVASGHIEFGWDIPIEEICLAPPSLSITIEEAAT